MRAVKKNEEGCVDAEQCGGYTFTSGQRRPHR